jgi:putative flippase GtrA
VRRGGIPVWGRRFIRYAAGSVVATLTSAGVFALVFQALNLGPRAASIAAFLAGAAVNFVAGRFWAWKRNGPVRLRRDVVAYLALSISIAVAATIVTSLTDHYARRSAVLDDHLGLVVEGSYFATYGAMFLIKFAILDRVVFRHSRHDYPDAADSSAVDSPTAAPSTAGLSTAGSPTGSPIDAVPRPSTAVKPSAPATGSST